MNNDNAIQRFEILKMAREMLNQEYTFKRATDHNKWLVDSHEAWTKYQRALPHPPFEPYPTESKVLDAAEALYRFVYNTPIESTQPPPPVVPVAPTPPVAPIQQITPVVPVPAPVVPVVPAMHITEGDLVFTPEPVEKVEPVVIEPKKEEPSAHTESKSLLPGWIRRTSK
jgi:hypothetical protein